MSKFTYLNRLKRMDYLIRTRATGNTVAFAKRLHVSRSELCEEIKVLREMGAPIFYSRMQQTYFYKYPTTFCIEFYPTLNSTLLEKMNKEQQTFLTNEPIRCKNSSSVQYCWTELFYTCIKVCGQNLVGCRKALKESR